MDRDSKGSMLRLLVALSSLWCVACGTDETYTSVFIQAGDGLKDKAAELHVRIESDGVQRLDEHLEKPSWPVRYNPTPRDGDATRKFTLLAELLDGDGKVLAASTLHSGFVSGKTRYVRLLLCNPKNILVDIKPADLAVSESDLETSSCQSGANTEGGAGGKGQGGEGGMAGAPKPMDRAGAGGAGGAGGVGGRTGTGGDAAKGGGGGMAGKAGPVGGVGGDPKPPAPTERCGDGMKTMSEQCDTAIADGQPDACPKQCSAESGNACRPRVVTGEGCQQRCEVKPITAPINGDGCCLSGFNHNSDTDCGVVCGNKVVEEGETCDPCDAATLCGQSNNPCVRTMVSGDAMSCKAVCTTTIVTQCMNADSCCPSGCSRTTDSDCPLTCGDGMLDEAGGETCENGSSTPCPTSCDDGDSCTDDTMEGSASNCNVRCSHTPVVTPSGRTRDNCCPKGANANVDVDCDAMCGNGTLESGEKCDGNCPKSNADCDDHNACTRNVLSGSGCSAECTYPAVSASVTTPDSCCPSGATGATDIDCNLLKGIQFKSPTGDSTTEPGNPISYVTDGDTTSRWISLPQSPVTLTADLGANYTITKLVIVWAGDTIQDYDLAISTNNTDFTTFFSGTTHEQQKETRTYEESEFSPKPVGRYLRVVGKNRWSNATNQQWGNSIYEISAYGRR